MIDRRAEAAARENIDIGGLDLLKMDVAEDPVVAVSEPLAAQPLFTLSPITTPQAAFPPHNASFNASPLAFPPSEHNVDVLMDEWEKSFSPLPSQLHLTAQNSPVQPSWSPLRQAHLLQSNTALNTETSPLLQPRSPILAKSPLRLPLLPPWSPIPTKSREQNEELPMLDQAWSRQRKTTHDPRHSPRSVQRRRPQTHSVYRRNNTYSIADDIEAGMREEEDDVMASPSARKATSFSAFTFSPPSNRLFTRPGVRPRVTKTYATKARVAQSSPSYKAASSTKPQRSGLSHSSPSYGYREHGLLDATMDPKLSTVFFAQPAEVPAPAPAPAPLRTTQPQTPPRSPKLTKHQELHALLSARLAKKQEGENPATWMTAAPLSTVGQQQSPLPSSSPLPSLPSSPSSPCPSSPPASSSPTAVGRGLAAQDHWCSLLINTYNFAISNTEAWGGGEAWGNLVTMVVEFLDPLMENGQHPVRLYFNVYLF